MDKRTLGFVWIVLAHLRAQTEENQAARNMEPALPLCASAVRGFLPFGSAGGALRMAGGALCSHEPGGGMDRRSADRRRRGCRAGGPVASPRQLVRNRPPQRAARADSHPTRPPPATQPLREPASGSEGFFRHRADRPAAPSRETLPDEAGNGMAILINQFQPRQRTHLGEIDSPETHSGDENIYAIAQRLVLEGIDSMSDGFRAVGMSPPGSHFGMSFLNGHLQRRVRHREWYELLPVFWPRQSPGCLQSFVKRRRGQRSEQSKDGQSSRPGTNLLKRPLRDTYGVVVHAKNKRGDGINVAPGKPLEHGGILTRLVETLVYVGQACRIDGLPSDKDPLSAAGRNEVHELLVTQEIGADLSDPVNLATACDDGAQQGCPA